MKAEKITVATAQLTGATNVDENIRNVARMSAEAAAKGAELIIFPEAVMYEFTASARSLAEAAERGDEFEAELAAIASQHRIAIVAGLYRQGRSALAQNVITAIGPDGEAWGRYHKLHLYDAFQYKESDKSEPAALQPDFRELLLFDQCGFRFGIVNCYDLRFPEMMRALVERGANVLLVSAAWVAGPLKAFHWSTLLYARAIENTCFVAASCQPGPTSVGLSMVIDPNGVPMSIVPEGEGLAIATLDAQRLVSVRQTLPSLAHRRYTIAQNPSP